MLRGIEESLEELSRSKDGEKDDCRGLSPEKTVRCAAQAFGYERGTGGVAYGGARSVFGHGADEMGHSYHGPFQYLYCTYESQQARCPTWWSGTS